jgi:hypothetical protein
MKTRLLLFAALVASRLCMMEWCAEAQPTSSSSGRGPGIDLQQALNGYESASANGFQGLVQDWMTHHLVYSSPPPGSHAYDTVTHDPRYWLQQIRRGVALEGSQSTNDEIAVRRTRRNWRRQPQRIRPDWSFTLGSGATVGNEMFPAKFSFSTSTASCDSAATPDFVAFNTSLAGSSSQPNLVAFDNLYSGCSGTIPLVYFAYDTGGGTVVTSPTLSVDGTKLAFVETSSGSHAVLRILQWVKGQGSFSGSVWSAHAVDNAIGSWSSCTSGSCMVSLTFNGNPQDTNSSPFYDFTNDALYVGDDSGVLHKFTPVFSGTPAEVTTGGWPITVNAGTVLSSPALDPTSRNIFVGDAAGHLSYARETGSISGACGTGSPPCLGSTNIALGGAVVDGPIIDPSTEKVFWFNEITAGANPTLTHKVVQTDTALGGQVTVSLPNNAGSAAIGNMHTGAFDNAYLNAPSTGHLYVCGQDATSRNVPTLWDIGFTANGTMNGVTAGGPLGLTTTTPTNECSPLTEIFGSRTVGDVHVTILSTLLTSLTANFTSADFGSAITGTDIPADTTISAVLTATSVTLSQAASGTTTTGSATIDTDWLFAGVQTKGTRTGCSGACLYSFSIANAFPADSRSGLASTGGTSGLIIDNTATSPAGTSEVYFTPLADQSCTTSGGTGGCATQASHAGLN